MEFDDIALVAGFVLAYSLVSRRLETTPITGPMVFVGFGMFLHASGWEIFEMESRCLGDRSSNSLPDLDTRSGDAG